MWDDVGLRFFYKLILNCQYGMVSSVRVLWVLSFDRFWGRGCSGGWTSLLTRFLMIMDLGFIFGMAIRVHASEVSVQERRVTHWRF